MQFQCFTGYLSLFIVFACQFGILTSEIIQPKCRDSEAPFSPAGEIQFCEAYADFGCCTHEQDEAVRIYVESEWTKLESVDSNLLPYCYDYLKNLTCLQCSPYSFGMFFNEVVNGEIKFAEHPKLCDELVTDITNACPEIARHFEVGANTIGDERADDSDGSCYPIIESEKPTGELDGVCLKELAGGLRNPLALVHAGDKSDRLFIVEHIGVIRIMEKGGELRDEPFIDLQEKVFTTDTPGDERGLLSLAFHPKFSTNGYFYVYYSRVASGEFDHRSVVSRFTVHATNTNKADLSSEMVILEINQPGATENGGQLVFGKDGYLYITVGYGGADDEMAADKSNLLGSILRIDVDTEDDDEPYQIPIDNPFVNVVGARPEIYAYGFHNPWRCSVDPGSLPDGTIFCGDVGDNIAEEINVIHKGSYYGWYHREGHLCRLNDEEKEMCDNLDDMHNDDQLPIHFYEHTPETGNVNAVVGGFVYRGCQSPNLKGFYIYADYILGKLWYLTQNSSGQWINHDLSFGNKDVCNYGYQGPWDKHHFILAFGEDEQGEVYMMTTTSVSNTDPTGTIYQIVDPARRTDPSTCSQIDSITIGEEEFPVLSAASKCTMTYALMAVSVFSQFFSSF
ncbi:HHIP-like protein 2 [Saccoglossus kowalevskii]